MNAPGSRAPSGAMVPGIRRLEWTAVSLSYCVYPPLDERAASVVSEPAST